jgi:hypothetical protein
MHLRQAKLSDENAVLSLAIESVSRDPLPVTISRAAMSETFRELVGRPQHFCWVATVDGEIVGAVVAQTAFGFWFERQQSSVLLYYSRVTGASLALLREYMRWLKARPVIKLAVLELEPSADPRLAKVLRRLGFQRESMNLTYVRTKQ